MKTLIAKAKCALLAAIAATAFTACDTEGENVETGYTVYRYNIVYPENQSVTNLAVTLDGDTVSYNGLIRPGRDGYTGQLQVACSDYTTLEEEITLHPGDNIPLLFLPDGTIAVYDSASYLSFNASFILNEGMTAELNGQPIVNGLNYLANEKANGDLQFYAEGTTDPAGSMPVAITEGSNLNVMQLDESTFVEVVADDEPAPTSNKIMKACFLYMGDDVLSMDEIRLDFYLHDEWCWVYIPKEPVSVTLRKGEFSEYIDLDISFVEPDASGLCADGMYGCAYYYDVVNPATGEILINHESDYVYLDQTGDLTSDGMTWNCQKGTFMLKNGGQDCELLRDLSTFWEQ